MDSTSALALLWVLSVCLMVMCQVVAGMLDDEDARRELETSTPVSPALPLEESPAPGVLEAVVLCIDP